MFDMVVGQATFIKQGSVDKKGSRQATKWDDGAQVQTSLREPACGYKRGAESGHASHHDV
jgi:hypothetical protein